MPRHQLPDLVRGNALVLLRLLRWLGLQRPLGVGQALPLLEKLLLELRRLLLVVLVDQRLDGALVVGLRVRERRLD